MPFQRLHTLFGQLTLSSTTLAAVSTQVPRQSIEGWNAWNQGGPACLEYFTTGASDWTISANADTSHPHLVSYGSGSSQTVGDQFTIEVPDHNDQASKAYPEGGAAYPVAWSSNISIRIVRVMP
jgi:hypothetical protein